jgi:hypothetical protein
VDGLFRSKMLLLTLLLYFFCLTTILLLVLDDRRIRVLVSSFFLIPFHEKLPLPLHQENFLPWCPRNANDNVNPMVSPLFWGSGYHRFLLISHYSFHAKIEKRKWLFRESG